MTNVKIKLMFFLLNALLTADFVASRPGNIDNASENATNTFSNVPNNSTEFLSVETNFDTLTVADGDQTPEQTNTNANNEMEAIMNAEQDRDELILSKKNLQESAKPPEINKEDAIALEKQLNTSSPLLEEIIDSETGREETLTDIMFRSELGDSPRFEFLISSRKDDTNSSVNKLISDSKNSSEVFKKSDYVELVAIGKGIKNENNSALLLVNITGHELDNDLAPDTRFTDLQTLFLACFATLLPLLGVLFASLCIRCMCRRWCGGRCRKESVSSDSESSDQKDDDRQTTKSQEGSTGTAGDTLDTDADAPAANGSIITMTLKNNHLIVETEERSDIAKNGRETKMKYSPDNDGIFVVEVQQSTAYRTNHKPLQNSPPHDQQISTNQALIHRAEDDLDINIAKPQIDRGDKNIVTDIEQTKPRGLAMSNTGLSISDLSMSSIDSQNASYSYGSQTGYEQGQFGYPIYGGYDVPKDEMIASLIHESSNEPLISKTATDPDKPVVTAAIFKQDSIIGNDALQGPGYCIEGSSDGPLLSDVQAREVSLQQIHHQMEKKLENGIEECIVKVENPVNHRAIQRADSLPADFEDMKPDIPVEKMDTIEEDDIIIDRDILKSKRASLPIIRTEMYDSETNGKSPNGSPKFEQDNEARSNDFFDNPPPMITITEENEVAVKYENEDSL